jgi:hypothetical protein
LPLALPSHWRSVARAERNSTFGIRRQAEISITLTEERRSVAVERHLTELGVLDSTLNATSRGELDSTGTDEMGWSADRRVDVELGIDDTDVAR